MSAELALARSRAYGLLGELLLDGLGPGTLTRVQSLPALAELLPSPLDLDEVAADHHDAFHRGVFPHAGVFLDPARTLGGPAADAAARVFREQGFNPERTDVTADHLGLLLGCLAWLAGAEGDALFDEKSVEATRLQEQQRRFMDGQLLSWLPVFVVTLRRVKAPLWGAVVELAVGLLLQHRAALGGAVQLPPLPERATPLKDPKTGLRRIAEHLLIPCHSGMFLSQTDLAALGQGQSLPRGFGDRAHLLTNLLKNAAEYKELPALVRQLREITDARGQAMMELAQESGLGEGWVAPWLGRLEVTRGELGEIGRAAGE